MSFINQTKTVLLLGLLTALLLGFGYFLGGASGLTFAFLFSLAINFGFYWFSDKLVLKMYRAQPLKESDHPEVHKSIEDIAQQAHLPKPKMYLVPQQTPNAFATGRNPQNAVVAVTSGILQLLNKDELKGVLAHEMSHIKNRDLLISTLAAAIAGTISYLAMMVRWAAIFGGFGGRDRQGSGLELLVLAFLAPFIALLIRMAVSRSREYLADSTGAKLIGNPEALASALEKLERANKAVPMKKGNPATSHLFIVNPFRKFSLLHMFSTHPPLNKRVEKLRNFSFD